MNKTKGCLIANFATVPDYLRSLVEKRVFGALFGWMPWREPLSLESPGST
nr:hypothetical protein [Klebsiella pneumoniae]